MIVLAANDILPDPRAEPVKVSPPRTEIYCSRRSRAALNLVAVP